MWVRNKESKESVWGLREEAYEPYLEVCLSAWS